MLLTLRSAKNSWNNNKENRQKFCEKVKFDMEFLSLITLIREVWCINQYIHRNQRLTGSILKSFEKFLSLWWKIYQLGLYNVRPTGVKTLAFYWKRLSSLSLGKHWAVCHSFLSLKLNLKASGMTSQSFSYSLVKKST